jgi:hypothetical protein
VSSCKPDEEDQLEDKKETDQHPAEKTGSVESGFALEAKDLWHDRGLALGKDVTFAKFSEIPGYVFDLWHGTLRLYIYIS